MLLLTDGRPHTFHGQDQALAAVRAGRLAPLATATRTPGADRPQPSTGGWIGPRLPAPGTVGVPRDPRRRGLPVSMDVHIPLDPAIFGYAWELCGWTVQPDVLLVLGDPKTEWAALHDTPELAAHSIRYTSYWTCPSASR
ncbi:hypothetical protein AB0O31_19840 [Kitasatospora cineracea]|uniref:hypothetical protein n=1 Tax=Kitasatospora cineracea TaxID=88074 RepID=UPI00343D8132